MQLKRTQRKMLERLGVPYTEERVGWRGKKRYGITPVFALIVSDKDYKRIVEPELERTAAKRAKTNENARRRREKQKNDLAAELGVLKTSRTFKAFRRGVLEKDEAQRIGRITAWRHENTNYDDLLNQGYSKEQARRLMEPFDPTWHPNSQSTCEA